MDEAHPRSSPEHVGISYGAVVALVGEPNSSDDETKTDVAWDLECDYGRVHVYNYKNGPAYGATESVADIFGFSLRGDTQAAVDAFVAMCEAAK